VRRGEKRLRALVDIADAMGYTTGSTIEEAVWLEAARIAGSGRPPRDIVVMLKAKALDAAERPQPCRSCGQPVESARRCYAIPTCYRCLPPPRPLPVNLPRSMRTTTNQEGEARDGEA
jgi:hypothetical protein